MVACIGYAIDDEKPKIITIRKSPTFKKDPTNDSYVVKQFSNVLRLADMQVHWYGRKFDFPFIQSRLLYHNLPIMPKIPFWDGQKVAYDNLKLSSNRLASVQAFLNLPTEKTAIKPGMWLRAISGHVPSLKYIEDHCLKDVDVLRQAYKRMRALNEKQHPSMQAIKQSLRVCDSCGELKHLQKRGISVNRRGIFERLQCMDCGRWQMGQMVSKMPKIS